MEKTNKRSFFKSKVFILIFAILFIAIIIFLAVDASKKRKIVAEWEDKIYPGVTMCDIDFGGKTREEAEAIIKNDITLGLANKIITIKVGDKAYQYKYSDFNTTIEYNESLDKAIKYGKNLDNEEQYNMFFTPYEQHSAKRKGEQGHYTSSAANTAIDYDDATKGERE